MEREEEAEGEGRESFITPFYVGKKGQKGRFNSFVHLFQQP